MIYNLENYHKLKNKINNVQRAVLVLLEPPRGASLLGSLGFVNAYLENEKIEKDSDLLFWLTGGANVLFAEKKLISLR